MVLASWAALFFAVAGGLVVLLGLSSAIWNSAVPFALELWTGAALLVLIGEQSWQRIAGAALVVILRCIALRRWPVRAAPTRG